MSDSILIQRLKENDDSAIEELITIYGQYIAAVVYRVGGLSLHAEDVEEVVSDVFYAVWKSRHKILQTESLKPYLAQIARNMTRNKWRHVKHDQPLDDQLAMANNFPTTDDALIQKENVATIKKLIATLKPPDNDILYAYYIWNYKLEDIALMYNLPLSTVKSKIYRGRRTIVECFEGGGNSYGEFRLQHKDS
ncbi:RNA polymerase sigma factor [Paenibacillus camelliae]|uniref:RNA polymerase sigma factor n=1 Tax=Paenibacillus camelliae TaxID=512410 RepID=UPI00203F3BD0|nr:sigma-70 family RNA polymerase sigma factor [Paenibacillus camelliae]MCM3633470.1 sigma-70 family RNA polymerase sigma factor [Paenibacillus camelliae]